MNITDLRLKIRHFIKKNLRVIFIVIIIWLFVFFLNQVLKLFQPRDVAKTTYTPQATVIDNVQIPTQTHNKIEEMIDEFVGHCNNDDFDKAYSMLSSNCKKYVYDNNLYTFQQHVLTLMPEPRNYAIQAHSNPEDNMYVYNVNYFPDYLSTGLTNQEYKYTTEKMTFKKVGSNYEMSVGDFYDVVELNSVSQNDYVRIEILDKIIKYEKEVYTVRIKNRSEGIMVIQDNTETDEIFLKLSNTENRLVDFHDTIVLSSQEDRVYTLEFPKYVDDEKVASTMNFNDIRIYREYFDPIAMTKEELEEAKANSLAKFSIRLNVMK